MSSYYRQDAKLWEAVKIGRSKYRAIGRDHRGIMLWKGSGPTIYTLIEKAQGEWGLGRFDDQPFAQPIAQQFSRLSKEIKQHVRAQQKSGQVQSNPVGLRAKYHDFVKELPIEGLKAHHKALLSAIEKDPMNPKAGAWTQAVGKISLELEKRGVKMNPLTRDEANVLLEKGREALDLAGRNLDAGFPVTGTMHAGMAYADARAVETAAPRKYASHHAQGADLRHRAYGLIKPELDREARRSVGLKPNPLTRREAGKLLEQAKQHREKPVRSMEEGAYQSGRANAAAWAASEFGPRDMRQGAAIQASESALFYPRPHQRRHNPGTLNVGDRVMYSRDWLKSTGTYTGEIPQKKGVIKEIQDLGSLRLATVLWEGNAIPLWSKVNILNLRRVGVTEPQNNPLVMTVMGNPGVCRNPSHSHRRRNPVDYQDVYSAAQKVGYSVHDAASVASAFKRTGELPRMIEAQLRYFKNPVEGWAVTRDGETLKTFPREQDAMAFLLRHQGQSIHWAVKYEGYDIVEVRGGKIAFSYRRDILRNLHKGFRRPNPTEIVARVENGHAIQAFHAHGMTRDGKREWLRRQRADGKMAGSAVLTNPKKKTGYLITGDDPGRGPWAITHKTSKELLEHIHANVKDELQEYLDNTEGEEGNYDRDNAIEFKEMLEGKVPFDFRALESLLQGWKSTDSSCEIENIFDNFSANPLNRREAAHLLRDARTTAQRARTAGTKSGKGYLRGRADGLATAVGRYGPKRQRMEGVTRIFQRTSSLASKNPNLEYAVFRHMRHGKVSWGAVVASAGWESQIPKPVDVVYGIFTGAGKREAIEIGKRRWVSEEKARAIAKTRGQKYVTNPGKTGTRRKVTMTLEAFAKMVKAKRDPKLWAAFLKKVADYKKWSHGTLPKKVTVEQVNVPGMSGMWMTYDAGKAPETAYVMPHGTKRKGAWVHEWETMPELKNDPDSGIVLTKLKGRSRITDFYHK